LKRRRVFRVAAFYGGIAFVLVQIIDGTFEVMGVPSWVSRLLIVLLAAGFPVAMGLAWVFDVTPEGIVKTGRAGDPASPGKAQPGDGRPLTSNRALIAVAVAAVAFGIWGRWGGGDASLAASVAVLPFATFSTGEDDLYFADGITDNIITQLYKVSGLKVIARTSVMQYKGTTKRMNQIGAELGVGTLLEGSIQRSPDRVIVTAQLIDVQSEAHLWAETYDRNITDLFDIQNEVARQIAQALKGQLTAADESALEYKPTENLAAWEAYAKGITLYNATHFSRPNLGRALAQFEAAAVVDPAFVEAHAYQAMVHLLFYWFGYDESPQRLELARQAVEKAEQIAPEHPFTLLARGRYYYHGFRDYGRALQVMYRALDLSPENQEILFSIAFVERRLAQFEAAYAHQQRAIELDPRSGTLNFEIGATAGALGRYEEANEYLLRSLQLDDSSWGAYVRLIRNTTWLTGSLEQGLAAAAPYRQGLGEGFWQYVEGTFEMELGDLDRAVALLTTAIERLPKDHQIKLRARGSLGLAYIHLGDPGQAEPIFRQLVEDLSAIVDAPIWGAVFRAVRGVSYSLLGDKTSALADVDQAWETLPNTRDAGAGNTVGVFRALVYLVVGDHDAALRQWDELLSYSKWDIDVRMLETYRTWAPLKDHPGFRAVIDKHSGGR
ncbi:MAG: tetratricopeptide repeat protein, partial [Candidatus Neomarinimicrobiota bacterium]